MGNSVTPRAGTMLTPVPRNGVMEISGAVRLTVDYVDQKSGVVGQTATVNAVCGDVALGTRLPPGRGATRGDSPCSDASSGGAARESTRPAPLRDSV